MKPDDEKVQDFAEELRGSFSGEVHVDRFTCLLYATDASIYQMDPRAVVVPRNHDDVAAAVSLAARFKLPILPRGAGTSLAGQTVGDAVVIDFTKYMNQILEVNREERCARVQPGVVLDQLNAHVKSVGLAFGPDVSTSSRATIGGMIGNNSCGARSVAYGLMVDHVRELRILLAAGDEARFQELTPEQWNSKCALQGAEGLIYRTVDRLVGEHQDEIAARYPKVMRHVGGYSLDRLVGGNGRNLSRLIAGSEGTLATLTEAVVELVPLPRVKALGIVHFGDLVEAMDAVEEILTLRPVAIELIDKNLLDLTRKQPVYARKMKSVEGDPAAILIVEFYGDSRDELRTKLESLDRKLREIGSPGPTVVAETPEAQADVWAIRKAGLGMLSSIRGDIRPLAFVEDTAVPPRNLGPYVVRFQKILQAHGTRAGFYGHASAGCLHIRPMLNLKDPAQVQKMVDIATAVKDLVMEFGGAMTGEHGDGLVRSHWNRELFGERLYSAFRQLKGAFDPASIMNPGKIVDAPPMTSHLRYGDGYRVQQPDTYLDFTREGGLIGAVEQCSGLGACRKADAGTMCPSYRATREEEYSTRGRANALRLALTGRLGHEGFASHRIYEALDLCLECKACKTECEANVDMAKLKSEFLAQYNASHGTPMRSQLFGDIAWVNRLGSAAAPLSNWIVQSRLFRQTVQRMLGVDPRRRLPLFARPTFRRWLRDNPPRPPRQPGLKVVLFTDTFANFNETGAARAVLRLLESTGAEILTPELECCGRPMISKGLLAEAREKARHNVSILRPLVEEGAWIVGCEPSCMLTLRDEYPDLLRTEDARKVAGNVFLIEEFLVRQLDAGLWKPHFSNAPRTVMLHGHCHQKSLVGTSPSLRLLRLPSGFKVGEIDAGCCGMAGTFGWESEHYALSMQIGETSLFPSVRNAPADADIVADGISCRLQILHGTGRRARHIAEVLADALEDARV
jgi:FAD/FMN-containing dehydrogenase/Fe-S oxidoreductase